MGNGLESKAGTMRVSARAGRGDWLTVSAVGHCSTGKGSVLSGEGVFLQGRGQRRAGFIAGSCKARRARDGVRGSSVNYSIVRSQTARNLYGAIKTKVLK